MTRQERYREFIKYFSENLSNAQTELQYSNSYELLVAVILSAQCTDKRVNSVTPALFRDFPTPDDLAQADPETVYTYIKSVSYPNNKSKHLVNMARMLVHDFNSEIPPDTKDLQKLPGVGRKTANVIASVIYNQPTMAVDTHVFRVSKRLGLVNQNAGTPLEVEKQLLSYIPEEYVHLAHHWLILHGRYICLARNPRCNECKISYFCRYYEKNIQSKILQKKQ